MCCKESYKIVVAVPTKSRLAFSSPALLGCSLVSLASGRLVGNCAPGGRSRVGASELLGSIVRCFIVRITTFDELNLLSGGLMFGAIDRLVLVTM